MRPCESLFWPVTALLFGSRDVLWLAPVMSPAITSSLRHLTCDLASFAGGRNTRQHCGTKAWQGSDRLTLGWSLCSKCKDGGQ
eukprot:518938-Pelagomonas_calceolata.AAC.1